MQPLTRDVILDAATYEAERDAIRRRVMVMKDRRRVEVGDHCVVLFENHEINRYQVHEMLRAERSWERPGAVEDELAAYNPLIPQQGELSATVMFPFEDAAERTVWLQRLLGIERHLWLQIGTEPPVAACFDGAQIGDERVSSVQFVKWRLDEGRRDLLKEPGCVVRLFTDHPAYAAVAVLSEQTRREIMSDPD